LALSLHYERSRQLLVKHMHEPVFAYFSARALFIARCRAGGHGGRCILHAWRADSSRRCCQQHAVSGVGPGALRQCEYRCVASTSSCVMGLGRREGQPQWYIALQDSNFGCYCGRAWFSTPQWRCALHGRLCLLHSDLHRSQRYPGPPSPVPGARSGGGQRHLGWRDRLRAWTGIQQTALDASAAKQHKYKGAEQPCRHCYSFHAQR
jgi:hypothetical protein